MGLTMHDKKLLYEELKSHHGHEIACVQYAGFRNVAIECNTCCVVLVDADKQEEDE